MRAHFKFLEGEIMRRLHSWAIPQAIFAVLAVGASSPALAQQVDAGYDLFSSDSGTQFMSQPFEGVPLQTFNFGGAIGVQNTGETDTIVQRLANATPGSPTVPLQMDALQLVTPTPVAFGGGPFGLYYITLQSTYNGGTPSTGSMTVSFSTATSGTFSSSLDVFFDITYGALNGPIVYQSDLTLTNPDANWSDVPNPGEVLITGANYILNGVDGTNDFFVNNGLTESHPMGVGIHQVSEALVPEPTCLGLLLFSTATLLRPRRRAAV